MPSNNDKSLEQIAQYVMGQIRHRNVHTADVLARRSREDSLIVRQGQVETVSRKITRGVGVRVIMDGRLGFAHSSDVSENSLSSLVDRAVELAKESSPDPGHGLAEAISLPVSSNLDLVDSTISDMTVEEKIDMALRTEKAMFASDKRIARSGGCHWEDGEDETIIANTSGMTVSDHGTGFAIVAQSVAEDNGQMQSGWWWTQARHREDLDTPEDVGTEAGKRAASLLDARGISTVKAPVIFEAPVAAQVLSVLFAAMNGEVIRRRASYLVDKLNQVVASDLVTVIDDGSMPRKLGSQAVDDEGVPTNRKTLVDKGLLKQYLFDVRGARLSDAKPTGNAHRSYGSLPSVGPTNLYIEPGEISKEDLIKSVDKGLFLTRIMGSGVNLVTGDVSWGASGIWIENGELAYPVEGITIAGNLLKLWKNIDSIANDLEWRSNVVSPSFRVSEIMIGGK
jgi:PmbA protein